MTTTNTTDTTTKRRFRFYLRAPWRTEWLRTASRADKVSCNWSAGVTSITYLAFTYEEARAMADSYWLVAGKRMEITGYIERPLRAKKGN